MIDKAIQMITNEMKKDKNPYIQVVGNYVLSQIEINPNSIRDIASSSKTLKGSLKAMENEAKKKAVNKVAILTDEEGLAIVSKYFGFGATQISVDETIANSNVEYKIEEKKANKHKIEFNVNLDDLLK